MNRTMHRTSRTIKKALLVAAVITILSTIFVLASAGLLNDFFIALRDNSRLGRENVIVDHGLIAEVDSERATVSDSNITISTSINALDFNAYYIWETDLGFDFTLSNINIDIPDNWSEIFISEFMMEMDFTNGETFTWTETLRDGYINRTFPDGYYLHDIPNQVFETEGNNVFGNTVKAVKIGANDYSISVLNIHKNPITIGNTLRVSFKNINFVYYDIAMDVSKIITIEGKWVFETPIDNMFKDARPISYRVDERGYVDGIHIVNVKVSPLVCRIEARIDFLESGLGLPENANIPSTEHTTAEWQSAKMDMLDLELIAYSDGKTYHFRGSTIEYIIDDEVTALFEIDSMFFDAPFYLTLKFINLNGATVEIPLILNKD